MKIFKIAMITAMVAFFTTRAMAASNIVLSCKTYNLATYRVQTSFHPGDKVCAAFIAINVQWPNTHRPAATYLPSLRPSNVRYPAKYAQKSDG